MYAAIHSRLVSRTRAYRELYRELGVLCTRHAPASRSAALIPCSTGEVLAEVGPCAAAWLAVDRDPECLAACRARWPGIEELVADLGGPWPLPECRFDLVLSVHALHFLPSPQAVVTGIAASLSPGGVAMLVSYARQESVNALWSRVAREHGISEALNLLPWKLADSAMLLGGRARLFSSEALAAAVAQAGLEVISTHPTFRGISTLLVARKPGDQGQRPREPARR